MINMQEQINILETKIKAKYPDLKIGYSYDAEEDYYHIWHTNSHLQFEDNAFPGFIGYLIKDCFYSNDIFNFSFGYDYLEDEKSKSYEVNVHYSKIFLNYAENFSIHKSSFYQTIKHCSSFSWSKFDTINIAFDNLDLSFFNQSIRQADLLVESVENLDDQIEKALAA